MPMICERCKDEVYKYTVCDYCKRRVCFNCVKSSKIQSKVKRLFVCKDCWSENKKRMAYKNRQVVVGAISS